MIEIIRVNKTEVDAIREKFPNVHVRRTCQQKSKRHTYYVEETRGVIGLIRSMRGQKKGR
jgi:hypothetical protein